MKPWTCSTPKKNLKKRHDAPDAVWCLVLLAAAVAFAITMGTRQTMGFLLSAWLGGQVFEATGNCDGAWTIDILLAVGAALAHLPIKEAAPVRLPAVWRISRQDGTTRMGRQPRTTFRYASRVAGDTASSSWA